jgi:hypothetical protein
MDIQRTESGIRKHNTETNLLRRSNGWFGTRIINNKNNIMTKKFDNKIPVKTLKKITEDMLNLNYKWLNRNSIQFYSKTETDEIGEPLEYDRYEAVNLVKAVKEFHKQMLRYE